MQTSDIISVFALVVSIVFGVCNFIYTRRQTQIMQRQLDEQSKKKFTDEPYNAYTAKLQSISNNIAQVAKAISKSKDQNG